MKTFKIFIIILALSTGAAKAQFTKAELQVSGLTCSMCSKATEKSLRTLDFISDITVDLNRNIFVLTFKKGATVDIDQISKKVQGSGFFVNNLKLFLNLNNVKLDNNSFNFEGNTYKLVNGSNQTLNGLVVATVVDKGFAPASVYKKYPADNKPGKVYHLAI